MPLHTLLAFAFATTTPHGLTSRHAADSQAHSSKGTPSHIRSALTDCQHTVSGTLSLPSRGTFHHSLTVLSAIGHTKYSGLPGGPGRFTTDSTSPLLLGKTTTPITVASCTGLSPTPVDHPRPVPLPPSHTHHVSSHDQSHPTTPYTQPLPGITRIQFSHHPRSLATTSRIIIIFSSYGY